MKMATVVKRSKPRRRKIPKWLRQLDPDRWEFVTCCGRIRADERRGPIHICEACDNPSIKVVYKLYHPELNCSPRLFSFDPNVSTRNLYVGLDCAAFLCGYEDDVARFRRDLTLLRKSITLEIRSAETKEQTLAREIATIPHRIERARSEQQRTRDAISEYSSRNDCLRKCLQGLEAEVSQLERLAGERYARLVAEIASAELRVEPISRELEIARSTHLQLTDNHKQLIENLRRRRDRHNLLEQQVAALESYCRALKVLEKPLKLKPDGRTSRGSLWGMCFYTQQPRLSGPVYYWVDKKPPPNIKSDFYRADLIASKPDGECATEVDAIAAIELLLRERLKQKVLERIE